MDPITKELKLPRELPELKEPNELNPRRQRQGTSHLFATFCRLSGQLNSLSA
jgi:hypothetical protein